VIDVKTRRPSRTKSASEARAAAFFATSSSDVPGFPMRDAPLVHEHVRGRGHWLRRSSLPPPYIRDVAEPDVHGEAVRREMFRDLKTDSLMSPGDSAELFPCLCAGRPGCPTQRTLRANGQACLS
jgi:hypothetical protein